MRTIIIDDEVHCIETLKWQLEQGCPTVQIVAVCNSAIEGLTKIKELKPDLVFLDIEMPVMNGFDMLERIIELNFEVIFTTAYDNFAIKAFRFSALDYLLKPIDIDDLKAAVTKAEQKKVAMSSEQLEILFQFYKNNSQQKKRRLALTTPSQLIFADLETIIYCESDSNYTNIYLTTGEKVMVSRTLKDIEDIVEGNEFYRIHNSFLINLRHIKRYTRSDGGYVVMENDAHLTVSRKKKDDFFDLFSKL